MTDDTCGICGEPSDWSHSNADHAADPGRSGGEGTGEFDIQFTILRGGEEIGFGGATALTLEGALYEVQSIIQNEMWETANG